MKPSRNSKKRALEKLSTNTNTKKTHENQEMAPTDDFNDPIINTNGSQNESASKRGCKKMVKKTKAMDNHNNNTKNQQYKTTKGIKQIHKDHEERNVAIPQIQTIDELLNDINSKKEANSQNDKEIETIMSVIDSETNNRNNTFLKLNSVFESRTGSQNDFTSPRKIFSRPNPALLDINSQDDGYISPSRTILRPNSRSQLSVNSQNDDYFSSRQTSRSQLDANSQDDSRPNSRSQLGVNSQDNDYLSSRQNSRSQLGANSRDESRPNSRSQLGVNSQDNSRQNSRSRSQLGDNSLDDDYFVLSRRRTNGLDYYDYSNKALYPKQIRPSPLGPRSNTLNILNNTFNKSANYSNINEEIPSPFNEMTIYQLCSWLCKNPNVLQLANNMHLSMQTPVVEGARFISSISAGSSITTSNQEFKTKVCRDFLEELKCLFLRVRNPPKSAFEELIRQVLKNSIQLKALNGFIRQIGTLVTSVIN
ncbi:10377_t:CDS:2 [Rhizophagus irregularis]|nr:10377_t:CDS:2 [Rhizophagus irregularis]